MISAFTEKKFVDYIKVSQLILEAIMKDRYKRLDDLMNLFLAFISDYFLIALENYRTCINQNINLGLKSKKLFINFAQEYFAFLDMLCIDIEILDSSTLLKIFNVFYDLNYWGFIDSGKIKLQIQAIADEQKIRYVNLLKKIPFNQAAYKIGIYGTGRHTEGLLSIYEKLIGKVVCDIVFIDSKKEDHVYGGRNVINYRKLGDQDFDLIIISSFIYEQEMLKNLTEISSKFPIYTFYEGLVGDIFSDYKAFLEYC